LVFLLINGAIGQARVIPSGSMESTLLIGDHLIMSRVGYDAGNSFHRDGTCRCGAIPKRQQIIIFKPPFDLSQPDYVKRAIGLPGDIIDIHDGAVWINGERLVETYTLGKTNAWIPGLYAGAFGGNAAGDALQKFQRIVISRWATTGRIRSIRAFWGCVPRKDIIGTPVLILHVPERGDGAVATRVKSAKDSWPT
jgi:signal peptidase I